MSDSDSKVFGLKGRNTLGEICSYQFCVR